jgi:hypothetical protein
MSQTETHFGKLQKVEIKNQTLEQWCEIKCKEVGETKIESYYSSWQEQLMDCREYYQKYFFIDGEAWEAVEHIESDDSNYIDVMIPNKDGTITFIQQFYNGGTCLSECIEDGIKRIKHKL